MKLAYDGTDFHGWQVQPGVRTVQGEVEAALARVLGMRVRVHGAGRTDAGVHARGQVGSFVAETALPARALAPLLRRELPRDVRVAEGTECDEGFHARHSACARRYTYRLLDHDDVLDRRFAWHVGRPLDGERLHDAAAALAGEHDFAAFEAHGSQPGRPVCHVLLARWRREPQGWAFDVTADHFVYHMVRNLVGTMLAATRTTDPARHVRGVLESRDRARCGPTAPARGLCLEGVAYAAGKVE